MKNENPTAAERCLAFIDESVSSFHAVENIENRLIQQGFRELKESSRWEISPGEGYFVKRNDRFPDSLRRGKGISYCGVPQRFSLL